MPTPTADQLAALARPSGAFAMLALDQRESLRTMFAAARPGPIADTTLTEFKIDAARVLSPFASAVLLDVDFGLEPVWRAGALAPGCGLIVAADRLTQESGGPVESTDVDDAVLDDDAIAARADAYKLLVIWHVDHGQDEVFQIASRFLERCHARGRPGIVEGIVRGRLDRPALTGAAHLEAVVEAARQLGRLGPELYKAEVPTLGAGDDDVIAAGSREVTEALPCPWVVLSNGTSLARFPDAVLAACAGGASGFLAGRAIWSDSVSAVDTPRHLGEVAAPRLRGLAARIDGVAQPWHQAVGAVGTAAPAAAGTRQGDA